VGVVPSLKGKWFLHNCCTTQDTLVGPIHSEIYMHKSQGCDSCTTKFTQFYTTHSHEMGPMWWVPLDVSALYKNYINLLCKYYLSKFDRYILSFVKIVHLNCVINTTFTNGIWFLHNTTTTTTQHLLTWGWAPHTELHPMWRSVVQLLWWCCKSIIFLR